MQKIKEYANAKGVTYERVRKQLKRNENLLKGHIIKQGRIILIDDYAEKFLNERILSKNKQAVETIEQNAELIETNNNLSIQNNALQRAIMQTQQTVIDLQKNQIQLMQEKSEIEKQLIQAEQRRLENEKTIKRLKAEIEKLKENTPQEQAPAETLNEKPQEQKKTFLQRLFGK